MSTEPTTLSQALALAQGEFPPLVKDREVEVKLKDNKGKYTFRYATLDACLTCVRPALAKYGIALTTPTSVDQSTRTVTVTATLAGYGETLTCPLSWNMPGGLQDLGSTLTYLRRYAVCALLCLAADEDDDGNSAEGNEAKPTGPKPTDPISKADWTKLCKRLQSLGVGTSGDYDADRIEWLAAISDTLQRQVVDGRTLTLADLAELLPESR